MVGKTVNLLARRVVRLRAAMPLFAGAILALAFFAAAPPNARAAGPSMAIADGNPRFSSDQVNPGQYTTAHFEVTPDAGTAPNPEKDPPPTITSESFTATVDSQTTIDSVAVQWQGATVQTTIAANGQTCSFTITGSVPNAPFVIWVYVQASANASDGSHPVSLDGTSIDTTDGDGSGNTDTENFQVEKLSVDILGAPYLVINNDPTQPGYPLSELADSPVNTYTANATGGSGNYGSWSWTVSSNIMMVSGTSAAGAAAQSPWTSNPMYAQGSSPGAGQITCSVTDQVTHATGTGVRHPTVTDEIVVKEDSTLPTELPSGSSPFLFNIGSLNNSAGQVATEMTKTISSTSTYTVNATVGFNAGISAGVEKLASAEFGLNASVSGSFSGSSTYTTTLSADVPAGETVNYIAYCLLNKWSGTWQTWGPDGETGSGDWDYVAPESKSSIADGGFGTAEQ